MRARRIAIASPYPGRHNTALADYLTAQGFEIARAEGKDLPFKDMQNLPPADIQAFASGVLDRAGQCDALYLPCPQWQAAQVVDVLERERALPVVAYTHAQFFVAFRALGIAIQSAATAGCSPRYRSQYTMIAFAFYGRSVSG